MKEFFCQCGWKYIIGKKRFFGPIFEDKNATAARIQPIENFTDGYSHCYADALKKGWFSNNAG